jgi:mannobiose 2-epimerase
MLTLVRDLMVVPPGCVHTYLTRDWRPLPAPETFGHDVETAYLLIDAAAALNEPEDTRTVQAARQLVEHALEWGWDHERGGFYDQGWPFKRTQTLDKSWWTQAEGLNALWTMHERFGGDTRRYFDTFLRQWDFIWNYQADHRYGEWQEWVDGDGTPRPGQPKSWRWKDAYHNGRALMNVSAGLRRLAGSAMISRHAPPSGTGPSRSATGAPSAVAVRADARDPRGVGGVPMRA